MANDNPPPAYLRPFQDVLASLATDARHGLTETEARARLRRHGRNELAADKPAPAWRKFLAQFQDVLVVLLLIATAISLVLWGFERESALPYEAIAIFSIVLLNAVMGYVQTARAERAVAALRAMSAAEATVVRDGERRRVTSDKEYLSPSTPSTPSNPGCQGLQSSRVAGSPYMTTKRGGASTLVGYWFCTTVSASTRTTSAAPNRPVAMVIVRKPGAVISIE